MIYAYFFMRVSLRYTVGTSYKLTINPSVIEVSKRFKPNFDKLAANGLLYNNWHTTALFSPTKALTGRNHHSVGMANITELATGFPGYNGIMPKEKGRYWSYVAAI